MAILDNVRPAQPTLDVAAPALPVVKAWPQYGLMLAIVVVMGLPVYWLLTAAFKETREIYDLPITCWPAQPTLDNFANAWNAIPFPKYYFNSLLTTIARSGLELLFATTSAFAFAFLRFPYKRAVFLLMLAALMVAGQVTILPNYLTVAELGWLNTYQGIIIPGAATAYGTFLLRQYFMTLPPEVIDAAKVDGAGYGGLFWHIVLPLATPTLITFGLISVVANWPPSNVAM